MGEKTSGGRWDRPEHYRLFDQVRKCGALNALPTLSPVMLKLDRFSRSLRDTVTIVEPLGDDS